MQDIKLNKIINMVGGNIDNPKTIVGIVRDKSKNVFTIEKQSLNGNKWKESFQYQDVLEFNRQRKEIESLYLVDGYIKEQLDLKIENLKDMVLLCCKLNIANENVGFIFPEQVKDIKDFYKGVKLNFKNIQDVVEVERG